jgi:hypothetical protein
MAKSPDEVKNITTELLLKDTIESLESASKILHKAAFRVRLPISLLSNLRD